MENIDQKAMKLAIEQSKKNSINNYINGKNDDILNKHKIDSKEALDVFKVFERMDEKHMY